MRVTSQIENTQTKQIVVLLIKIFVAGLFVLTAGFNLLIFFLLWKNQELNLQEYSKGKNWEELVIALFVTIVALIVFIIEARKLDKVGK
jgi:hypothetical protein